MKILLSSHGASPYGAERVLLVLAAGLRDRGHDVTLEIPHPGPMLDSAREIQGVRVWLSDRPRLPRNLVEGVRYLIGAVPAMLRLWEFTRREQFHLVWANTLFNPLAAFAGQAAGAAVVWHVHERNSAGCFGWLLSGLMRAGCHVPVGVSRYVCSTFDRVWPLRGRMRVLLNAQLRPLDPLPLRRREGDFVVGYVGQIEPRKRVTDLLEAVARVPNARVLIVGNGKHRSKVETAVRRLRLEARVTLAGYRDDVAAFYREMDCVVLPAQDEPFGLVGAEALAIGRPVIAAAHGGHPEVLGDAAMYYPLGDAPALAHAIERLRDEPLLAEEMRERGLNRAAVRSPERWLDEAEALAAVVVDEVRGRTGLPESDDRSLTLP